MKTLEFYFKRNGIFIPIPAEVDIPDSDEAGFILNIEQAFEDFEDVIANNFPRYSVFAYDKNGEPELVHATNNYGDAAAFWVSLATPKKKTKKKKVGG